MKRVAPESPQMRSLLRDWPNRGSLESKRALTAYTFLAIPMLFFLGIRIAPTIYAFAMSFFKKNGSGFTLYNYQKMFASPDFWHALTNTLLYVIITVPSQLAIGIVLALMIGRIERFKGLYRTIYFLPYITSAVAISWVWRLMYDPNNGFINAFLELFHIPAQQWLKSPSEALVAVSIVIIWQSSGYAALISMAGLESIPKSYYEAARIDGASPWQLFWRITWPLLNPTLVFLAVTGVIGALQTFTQIANLTGGSGGQAGGPLNSTLSIVVYVYNQGFNNFNLQFASAVTVVLFILILIVTILQMKLINRTYDY
ncbi:carbohydrate ABC transporter permease [Gordoniibacillus kamchatkensis]|uniref:carbohydrate ABC transporter permease n=1 Tax=Gordoniibacillus kamchatkensis TaxID=1590651 RepID=UPI0018CE5226|nr:sugar ABC transporter permease [Paenibacillus sp. VKM B-2647]